MAQRLPKCAACGETLARRGRVLVDYMDRRILLGWHMDDACRPSSDAAWTALQTEHGLADDPTEVVAAIKARGPGRVRRPVKPEP